MAKGRPTEKGAIVTGGYASAFAGGVSSITAKGEVSKSAGVSPQGVKVDQVSYDNDGTVTGAV
jgi:hypothetical protein